jgi:hypothetical protein
MLSAYNAFVDTVKDVKTNFVKSFVSNDEIKKPLQTYIDAQAAFAKHMGHEVYAFMATVGNSVQNFDAKKAWATK